MKRIFGLAISKVVVVSLTYNGDDENSSIYAAAQARHPREIEQLFAGWNSHDPDKVAAAFTEDGVYEDVTAVTSAAGGARYANGPTEALAPLGILRWRPYAVRITTDAV